MSWWRLSVASFRMLYRDGQVLLIGFLIPLVFVFAFRLFDLRIVLAGSPALAERAGGSTGYFEFVLPGLLAMAVMHFAVFTVAIALSSYRDQQVLARISVTPMSPAAFLFGQLGSRTTLALAQVAALLAVGYLLGLRPGAGALWLFPLAIPGALIFLNIGFLLAGWTRSQIAATGLANLVVLPLLFLSGVFLPVTALPPGVREAVAYLPLTPLTELMRAALLDRPAGDPVTAALVLSGWLAATTALALLSFRRLLRR